MHGLPVWRVYATTFNGVIIDSKLTRQPDVDYISKKLSKYAEVIAKARENLKMSSLVSVLIHSLTHVSSIATYVGE